MCLKTFETKNILGTVLIALLLIGSYSCKSDRSAKSGAESELENINMDEDMMNDITTAKKIFYSLPSPLETAKLIKSAGAEYNEQLLNSVNSANNYTTNKSMALNLGIYTTDMSFASLFDQTQTTINYMDASKKMADGLGILDAIDDNTIDRLEANINNREAIMDIISETFMSSSSYLKENDRAPIATIVLVGGWIEGLYIATQIVGDKPIKDNKLALRVLEQKMSFEILLKLLDQYKEDADIQAMTSELSELTAIFEEIKIKNSESSVTQENKESVAIIKSKTEVTASQKTFDKLRETVKVLRNNFVK